MVYTHIYTSVSGFTFVIFFGWEVGQRGIVDRCYSVFAPVDLCVVLICVLYIPRGPIPSEAALPRIEPWTDLQKPNA